MRDPVCPNIAWGWIRTVRGCCRRIVKLDGGLFIKQMTFYIEHNITSAHSQTMMSKQPYRQTTSNHLYSTWHIIHRQWINPSPNNSTVKHCCKRRKKKNSTPTWKPLDISIIDFIPICFRDGCGWSSAASVEALLFPKPPQSKTSKSRRPILLHPSHTMPSPLQSPAAADRFIVGVVAAWRVDSRVGGWWLRFFGGCCALKIWSQEVGQVRGLEPKGASHLPM
jgi:hypothetical protein